MFRGDDFVFQIWANSISDLGKFHLFPFGVVCSFFLIIVMFCYYFLKNVLFN